MSYNEFQFKAEVISTAQRYYKLSELTFNPWVKDDAKTPAARTEYLKSMGSKYVEPKAGVGNVTISGLSSSTAWRVYKKSNEQAGDMFMGRLNDTGKLYEEFGLGSNAEAIYNLSRGKPINVQKLKDWTVLINDCWIIGAIHKHRTFRLVSKISNVQDIWNARGYFIVTGREFLGLSSFGYKPVKTGAGMSFVCENRQLAKAATLSKYAQLTNVAATSNVEKARIALFAQGVY